MVTRIDAQVWFPYVKVKPQARLRMFCFPYAGGGATLYRRWGEKFPPTIEVIPVQLPGRENRVNEAPYASMQELIADLSSLMQPYLDKPFVFFGHSMGAFIGYELARYLRSKKQAEPRHLFLSANRAAHLPNRWPVLHDLPREKFIQDLFRLGGTPRELLENEEALAVVIPLLRADFALCETYEYIPEPPLSASIAAFGGRDDKTVSLQELSAWQVHTQGIFMRHVFPGNHFFLQTAEEQLQVVTTQITQWVLQQL